MLRTILSTIAIVMGLIQTALPINTYQYYFEGVKSGSIYAYDVYNSDPPIVTYTKTSTNTDTAFDGYSIKIEKNIKTAINDISVIMPICYYDMQDEEIKRNLPINSKYQTRTETQAVREYISETYMYDTSVFKTMVCLPLQSGAWSTSGYSIKNWNIKSNDCWDFYCEVEGTDIYTEPDKNIHASLIVAQSNYYATTTTIGRYLRQADTIELNVNFIGSNRISIDGIILNNSEFMQNSAWTSQNGKIYLCIWSDTVSNFGARGMGYMEIYFPNNNADTWNIVYSNIFDGTMDETIENQFGAINNGSWTSWLNSAKNFILQQADGLQWYAHPIGRIAEINPIMYILAFALAFSLFRKAVE